eukprot:TRINITY_DN1743_c0_g1_i3.p1 TRINITY_DN1743_c0_g1~~TRINITY_DN1743_c0_g1_i3.p1  ORF type:complete len:303 (+),score=42.70 TRINITY_DN1743_c0_g1_i3:234-1142(+)
MVFDDLWVLNPQDNHYDGRAWTLLPIKANSRSPPGRCLSAVAVEASGVLYLYGGFNGSHWFSDFWMIDLKAIHFPSSTAQWEFIPLQDSTRPPNMCGMTALFIGGIMVMYGGGDDLRLLHGSAWEYTNDDQYGFDGWQEDKPGTPWPRPREFHSALLHADTGLMYVFGGYDYGYTYYNDTWIFSLPTINYPYATFSKVELTTEGPPGRALFASAYSQSLNQTLFFGGKSSNGILQDVWLFDTPTSAWTQVLEFSTGPGALYGMSSSYDIQGNGLIIFGGADDMGNVNNSTWFLPFPSNMDLV